MKIEILETFLDGRERYAKGELREVSAESGGYFCANGWARDTAGQVPTGERQKNGEVRLDVRSATHGHTAQEG